MNKWDRYFLDLAKAASALSKDPTVKVGAVITIGRLVRGTGYNGFAPGVIDGEDRYLDPAFKAGAVVHAEANAIIHATGPLFRGTCYVWPFPPCSRCAALLIAAGIERIVSCRPTPARAARYRESFALAALQYSEAGVRLELGEPEEGTV